MNIEQRKQKFLEKYAQLVADHGIIHGGCGCCGSPFLVSREQVESWREDWEEKAKLAILQWGDDKL